MKRRGIGGIFYDRRKPDEKKDLDFWFNFFAKACGGAFIQDAYIANRQKKKKYFF